MFKNIFYDRKKRIPYNGNKGINTKNIVLCYLIKKTKKFYAGVIFSVGVFLSFKRKQNSKSN